MINVVLDGPFFQNDGATLKNKNSRALGLVWWFGGMDVLG
jgi:hypothetical protein